MFFSLVRTNAPPLPGFTCWNSTTENRPSGRFRDIPFFRSLVDTAGISESVLNCVGEGEAALVGHYDGVLDADTSEAGYVHPRLDGDDVARCECIGGGRGQRRRRMDVQPHSM